MTKLELSGLKQRLQAMQDQLQETRAKLEDTDNHPALFFLLASVASSLGVLIRWVEIEIDPPKKGKKWT